MGDLPERAFTGVHGVRSQPARHDILSRQPKNDSLWPLCAQADFVLNGFEELKRLTAEAVTQQTLRRERRARQPARRALVGGIG